MRGGGRVGIAGIPIGSSSSHSGSAQVPSARARMLARSDWADLAQRLKRSALAPGAASDAAKEHMQSMLDAFNFMVDSSMVSEDASNALKMGKAVGHHEPVKLTLYRKATSGVMEAWNDMELHVEDTVPPTDVSLKVCPCSSHHRAPRWGARLSWTLYVPPLDAP
jgi:hypothetical protein